MGNFNPASKIPCSWPTIFMAYRWQPQINKVLKPVGNQWDLLMEFLGSEGAFKSVLRRKVVSFIGEVLYWRSHSLHGIFATYFLGFNNNMQDDTCCDIDIACIGI